MIRSVKNLGPSWTWSNPVAAFVTHLPVWWTSSWKISLTSPRSTQANSEKLYKNSIWERPSKKWSTSSKTKPRWVASNWNVSTAHSSSENLTSIKLFHYSPVSRNKRRKTTMILTVMKVSLITNSRANYLIMILPLKVEGINRTNLWWSRLIGEGSSRCSWISSRMPSNLQRKMDPLRFIILSTNRKANHTLRSKLKTPVWELREKTRVSYSNFSGLFKVLKKLTLVVSVLDSLFQRRSLRSSAVRLGSRASGLRAQPLHIGWN